MWKIGACREVRSTVQRLPIGVFYGANRLLLRYDFRECEGGNGWRVFCW